jgi:hypothetical protein
MIDATNASLEKAGIDERPARLLADAGYASEEHFAVLKGVRQVRSFMQRGKPAADSEWKPICGTHNPLQRNRRALGKPAAAPIQPDGNSSSRRLNERFCQPRPTAGGTDRLSAVYVLRPAT